MRRTSWCSTGAVLLALSSVLTTAAQAQNASMVLRDADSGQLRAPTPEEAQALQSAGAPGLRSAPTTGSRGVVTGSLTPQQWVLPNGTVIAETTEDMMSSMVAVRGEDGKLAIHCAPGETAAEHMAHSPMFNGKDISEQGHALK